MRPGHVVHHPVSSRSRWYLAAPVVLAVSVTISGSSFLHLNFDVEERALELLSRRIAQGHANDVIKTFEVYDSSVDYLRACAVPQSEASQFPGRPQIDDPTFPDQYALPASEFSNLLRYRVPGSGGLL